MPPTFPASTYCPAFQSSLEFLGRRWTASILRPLFDGPARFSDLLEAVPRLSSRLLAQRLEELADAGFVTRAPSDPYPVYTLTDKGRDLRGVFEALERWNRRWADADERPGSPKTSARGPA